MFKTELFLLLICVIVLLSSPAYGNQIDAKAGEVSEVDLNVLYESQVWDISLKELSLNISTIITSTSSIATNKFEAVAHEHINSYLNISNKSMERSENIFNETSLIDEVKTPSVTLENHKHTVVSSNNGKQLHIINKQIERQPLFQALTFKNIPVYYYALI